MAEYIEREAVIDEIEGATWYSISCQKNLVEGAACEADALYKATDIYNVIKSAPIADVVEVVRCKDCKHWQDNKTISFLAELNRLCTLRTRCVADEANEEQCPLLGRCENALTKICIEDATKGVRLHGSL